MTRRSEQWLTDRLQRDCAAPNPAKTDEVPFLPAFGTLAPDTAMNKTEAAYDAHLWGLRCRLYVWHKFEAIALKLAKDTRYTPDFAVQTVSGIIELHEVKGFWRDDARVKIKVAAAMFPFKFIAITRKGGEWKTEEF
jgi:hypothetical protein